MSTSSRASDSPARTIATTASPTRGVFAAVDDAPEALATRWRRQVAATMRDLRAAHPVLDSGDAERLLTALVDGGHTRTAALATTDDSPAELPGLARLMARTEAGRFDGWVRRIWSHMVRTAPIAQTVARAFGVPPHEALIAGLMHDVGKLALCDAAAALHETLGRDVLPTDALAFDALARLHEPVGGLVLLHWGAEPRLARAVAGHHRGTASRTEDRLAEVVYLAERLELARERGRAVTVDQWIVEGALTASPFKIAAVVEKVFAPAPRDGDAVGRTAIL